MAEPARAAAPDSAEAVLARGHAWLRFPKALEAAFNEDQLEPRRRRQIACAILGCLGVLIGSASVNEATPEIAPLVWNLVWIWMAVAMTSLIGAWLSPPTLRRHWHVEFLTATMGTAVALLITWMATASRADTAITHSAMAIIPVMYSCIAARSRFYWSLGSALITFAAYAGFVRGSTPEQAQLASGFTQLMALSYVFGLVASYTFEHGERRNWLMRQVEAAQRDALVRTSAQLRQLSIQDPLTGLFNRRHFDQILREAQAKAERGGQPLSLLAADVDFFKRYNDSHGHPVGDLCLAEISRVLATIAKAHGGIAARLGGEEFALLLPDLPPPLAEQAGEAVCRAISALRMPHGDSDVADHVTVSVGLAHWQGAAQDSLDAWQMRADRALYAAKSEGRNRLHVAQEGDEPSSEPVLLMGQASHPPEPEHTDEQATAKEALLQQTFDGLSRWLQFPAELEAEYIRHNADQRRMLLAVMALVGLFIYNVFALANRTMFPDIQDLVLEHQVWLSLMVFGLMVITYLTPHPLWREGLYSLSTIMLAMVSVWLMAQSRLTSTLSYTVSLMLIPMFSGVAARQPFWFTALPAVVTSVAAAMLLKPIGPVQRLVYADSLFMIVNNMAYTLILAYTLELGARREWLLSYIERLQRQALEAASQRLKALSIADPLTGICNRRQFEDDLDRIWHECMADQRPLGMLIIDIDHFKLYNDRQGHPAGDVCLKEVAALISQIAQTDKGLAARLGGEEFGVLLPAGNLPDAWRLAERIRAGISQACLPHDYAPSRHVTVSVGVASLVPQAGMDRISLFATADKALYEAKRAGRNRVVGPAAAPEHAPWPRGLRPNAVKPGMA